MNRTVTLMSPDGVPKGEIDILAAHRSPGLLHRAFSVFIFTPDRTKLMLQQRAATKKTFGSQWGNTCCSHQFPKEDDIVAGMRRLQEEMGFTVPLQKGQSFTYQANDPRGNGMSEHEHDTMLIGTAEESITVVISPLEADDWKWMKVDDLRKDLLLQPDIYVPWLPIAMQHLS